MLSLILGIVTGVCHLFISRLLWQHNIYVLRNSAFSVRTQRTLAALFLISGLCTLFAATVGYANRERVEIVGQEIQLHH